MSIWSSVTIRPESTVKISVVMSVKNLYNLVLLIVSQEYKWDPQRAVEEIKRKRPQAKPNKSHWIMLNSYYHQTK